MKPNFEYLERQWKERKLDLFPWLDGIFTLLRSREAILRETKRRLSTSTPATMVQFLSSDDHGTAQVAREVIKEQDPSIVLPTLFYSIEKVGKKNYSERVMHCLFDFNPIVSLTYLLDYLNLQRIQKDRIFQLIGQLLSQKKGSLSASSEEIQFLKQLFHALQNDLYRRRPVSGELNTWEDFEAIRLDLEVMTYIYIKTRSRESVTIVEREMQALGQEVIGSLCRLPFTFGTSDILVRQLTEIIPYVALMRLEADKKFLQGLPAKIRCLDLSEDQREEIVQKTKATVTIIDQPEMNIQEILDKMSIPFFFAACYG
ncbi:MAG: hypothetical protein ACMUIA_10035 [bacterium]